MSLHEYPSVDKLTSSNSKSVRLGAAEKNIFFRSSTFGVGTSTFILILDNNAEHNREGWFVAHMKKTVFLVSLFMVSISCRIWLTIESLFWFPSWPLSRVRLSHSSRKRRHGECVIPSLNIFMMFASLWPRYLENKFYTLLFNIKWYFYLSRSCPPETCKKFNPNSPAMAFAIKVFPFPGTPYSKMAFWGGSAPWNFCLDILFRIDDINSSYPKVHV